MKRLHDVFHVGLLKAYHHDSSRKAFKPFIPTLSDEFGPILEVERILDHRDVTVTSKRGKNRPVKTATTREYLVQWLGTSPADATWEPETNLVGAADEMLSAYRKSIGKVLADQRS